MADRSLLFIAILRMLDETPAGHEITFWNDGRSAWVQITAPDGSVQVAQRIRMTAEGAACDAQRPPTLN